MGSLTKNQYDEMVKKASPNSKIAKDCIFAFLIGGAICAVGQVILDFIKSFGFSKEFSSNFTSMAMIFLGSFLTAFNVYDKIAEYGKAGTRVPSTGFANSIVSAAMEFKSEGYILGLGAKMFTVAGPVLVFGAISSVVCGIIYYIFKMLM